MKQVLGNQNDTFGMHSYIKNNEKDNVNKKFKVLWMNHKK